MKFISVIDNPKYSCIIQVKVVTKIMAKVAVTITDAISPNFVCCCPSYRGDTDAVPADVRASEGVPVSSAASDTGSDSEDSTVPITRHKKEDDILREELANARREIEELKKLLAAKV